MEGMEGWRNCRSTRRYTSLVEGRNGGRRRGSGRPLTDLRSRSWQFVRERRGIVCSASVESEIGRNKLASSWYPTSFEFVHRALLYVRGFSSTKEGRKEGSKCVSSSRGNRPIERNFTVQIRST